MRKSTFSFAPSLLATTIAVTCLVGSFPAAAQIAAPAQAVAKPAAASGPTPRQRLWLEATPGQRIRLAEKIGETGARNWAKQRGWKPIMDGVSRGLLQGPDQVWRSADGVIHVIEAKGGGSPLRNAYGYRQGTPEWAVRSAERVLKSSRATIAERTAAESILKAAVDGRLEVHVVRTAHVLGEPSSTALKQSLKGTNRASHLAKTALDKLRRAATNIVRVAKIPAARAVRATSVSRARFPKAASVAGAMVLIVVLEGGTTLYLQLNGQLDMAAATERYGETVAKVSATGGAVWSAVLLGANPIGVTVIVTGLAVYIITDVIIDALRPYYHSGTLTVADINAALPSDLEYRGGIHAALSAGSATRRQ